MIARPFESFIFDLTISAFTKYNTPQFPWGTRRGTILMEIGIIADTHDRMPVIEKAVKFFNDASIAHLFHAGDVIAPFAMLALLGFTGHMHAVFGNNDGEREGLRKLLPDIADGALAIELEGKKIFLAHKQKSIEEEKLSDCDVAIFGHTHRAKIVQGKPLIINPGEACGWLYGSCTAAVLDLSAMKARIIEL